MALVVFLRGVNVGGHKTFRPTELAKQLQRFEAVNIGAAGTLVIRKPGGRRQLRAEISRRMPFGAEIVICEGREIVRLLSRDHFAGRKASADVVRFVSILSRIPRQVPKLPVNLPSRDEWLVKLLARDGRFVLGVYRRRMKTISYLGKIDRMFDVPVTTRNWNTITKIAKVLSAAT